MSNHSSSGPPEPISKIRKLIQRLVFVIAVSASLYHIYLGLTGVLEAYQMRSLHLGFLLPISFLLFPMFKERKESSWLTVDIAFFIMSAFSILYLGVFEYERIINRIAYVDSLTALDLIAGVVLVLCILEATRRIIGWSMVVIAIIAMLYALYGNILPGPFSHTGNSFDRMIEQLVFTTEGIFGIPLAASATFIFLFVLFGVFLEKSGVGQFFIDFSYALAGRARGGPAKMSVVASSLMGSISGSSTANVTSTGAYTIPLMKNVGYKPSFAGGVEAAASTGGQILPPVMGAASFLLAEFVGISYTTVIIAALIPALLYFVSVGFVVHFQAVKNGIVGLSKEEVPQWSSVLKNVHLSIPLIVIVTALFLGYTPYLAALIALASVVVVGAIKKATRMSLKQIIVTLRDGAKATIMIAVTCATAGIIIGVASQTGIGITFASAVIGLAQGQFLIILPLVMIASIILGMGLPTSAAYIMVAAIAVPALVELEVSVLAAHLFALYFGVFSGITPPVAISSYAAAGIADSKPMGTSLTAFKIAIPAFIIPYIFVFHNELLMQGEWYEIIYTTVTALIGVIILAASIVGCYLQKMNWLERIVLFLAAFGMISFNNVLIPSFSFLVIVIITGVQCIHIKKNRNTEDRFEPKQLGDL
ncbi:TRAP transporter permease [Salibacterium aidingense]|uniref:TRAP transporter permease n=1 Tax=Salibacterium aidingense TaxID=384933 RepID=UPI0003FCF719|nr:TRAP transporter permease [Salibacterium aidingense]